MTRLAFRFVSLLPALCTAAPAFANDSAQVPEGSALTLFALGLLGVIVGRRGAMRPKGRDEQSDID